MSVFVEMMQLAVDTARKLDFQPTEEDIITAVEAVCKTRHSATLKAFTSSKDPQVQVLLASSLLSVEVKVMARGEQYNKATQAILLGFATQMDLLKEQATC